MLYQLSYTRSDDFGVRIADCGLEIKLPQQSNFLNLFQSEICIPKSAIGNRLVQGAGFEPA